MSRTRTTVLAVVLGATALTACSSGDSDEAGKPITKQLEQGDLTQALPGNNEMPNGWNLRHDKGVSKSGEYCAGGESDKSPEGWTRGGSTMYEFNGSTDNMMFVEICQFDSPEHAKNAYASWKRGKGGDDQKEQATKAKVGEESTVVLREPSAYAYSRSGTVNIEVKVEESKGDTTGVEDTLAAIVKRLQQVQDGKRATATAGEEAAKAAKK
ncbi:hypothetical protein [Streptomyces olivoreticuli]|uniref:hypothetical protein n=1 Tax=Streptomyces olivoreticuli TaxID=68246 RepID=UPI000E256E1E|nr:hypothetical protein [Streptomyces olivoreticuli]